MELLLPNFGYPFLLIFSRLSAFMAIFPPFAWRGIPVPVRIFFALIISFLIALMWQGERPVMPVGDLSFVLAVAREIAAGLILGFFVSLFLSLFLMAGQFMDHMAGLTMGGVFDPLFGSQVTFIGHFFYLFAVVLFLTINGHHPFFLALQESFRIIPLAGPWFSPALPEQFFKLFAGVFLLAFQIAAPVIVVLLILDLALGFLSRAMPQINIFIISFSLKILLALALLQLLLPYLENMLGHLFAQMAADFMLVMESW
ncbi:MAG TPA: flagellar biosynthetic protein FliR [Firmicutes bacterium]|nr:flagellar biosynthetic protein FliR [Bacillota bacterium]